MVTGGPEDKPAFLSKERAESLPYVGAPPDAIPLFDHELNRLELPEDSAPMRGKGPTSGYEERWRMIAKLHARGFSNNQIARHLGYSAPGISLALQKPFVQAEVAKERDSLVSEDAVEIMKQTSIMAARRIQSAVADPMDRNGYDAAKFTLEKVTGKAKQEVAVESGTLATFNELMKQMMNRGEQIDVTPRNVLEAGQDGTGQPETVKPNPIDAWLSANLG